MYTTADDEPRSRQAHVNKTSRQLQSVAPESGMAGRYGGRHSNLKFGVAAPCQSDEI